MNNYFVCILLLPGDKPVILVVLHHTYDPEKNVSPQKVDPSQPFMGKVVLSVACLFYQGKFLQCKHNINEIKKVTDHTSGPIITRPSCDEDFENLGE